MFPRKKNGPKYCTIQFEASLLGIRWVSKCQLNNHALFWGCPRKKIGRPEKTSEVIVYLQAFYVQWLVTLHKVLFLWSISFTQNTEVHLPLVDHPKPWCAHIPTSIPHTHTHTHKHTHITHPQREKEFECWTGSMQAQSIMAPAMEAHGVLCTHCHHTPTCMKDSHPIQLSTCMHPPTTLIGMARSGVKASPVIFPCSHSCRHHCREGKGFFTMLHAMKG